MGNSRKHCDKRSRKRHLVKKAKKVHKSDVANLNRRISIIEQARKRKSLSRLYLSRKRAAEMYVNNFNII